MPPAVATNPYPQFLAQEYFNSYSDQLGFDSYEEFADSLLEADPQTLEDMADYLHKDQFGHIKKEDFDERIGMNLYRDELEPDGFLESFWESLKYSTTQANPQMYGKAMEAAGILMGLDTVKDAGEWVAKKAEGLDVGKAPEIELKDVDSSNFLQFLGESLGSGIGSTIPSIVSGVAGGAAGTAMGGPVGGAAGAIIGATITAAPMNMGEIYQQLVDEGIHKEDAALASLITNIPVTMLDVAGIERLLRVVPGSKVFKSKLMNNLSRAVTGAVQGSAAEGVTETGQSAIREAVAASMTDEPKVQERLLSVLHEGVVGAMTGGAIGGVRGAVPDASATAPAVEPEVMPAEPEVIPETEMDVEPADIEPETVEPEATEIDDEFEIIPDEERSVESMTLEEEANAGKRKVLDPTIVKEGDRVVVDNPTGMPEEGTVSEATENIVRVMNDAGSPIGVIVPGQPDNPNLYEAIPDEKELEAQRKAEEEAIKEQKKRMAEEEKEEKKKQEEAEKEARKKQEEAEKEARKKAEEEEKAKKKQEEETKKREDDLNAWRGEAERAMNRLDTNPEDTVSLEALRKLRNDQRFNQLESDERDTVDDYLLMMEKRAESEKIREEAINKEPGTPERKAIDEKIERTDKVVSDIQDRLAGITETTQPDNKAKEDRYLSALENKKKVRDEYKKEIDSLNAGIVPKFIADSVSSGTSIEARGEAIKKEVQKVRFDYEMELDRAEKEITQLEEGLENLRNLDKETQKEKKPKLKTPKEPKIAVPKPQKRPPRGVAFRDDRRGVNFTREEAKKILADAGIEVIETPGSTSDDLLVADEDWNKAFDLLDPEAAAVVKKMREKETGTATTPKGKIKALKKGDPGFDKMPPPDTIKTPAGNTHPVEHAIVDASQLVASNTFDGRINPAYPENLQPRHRDRVASEGQISDIMNKLDPRELAPAYLSEFGPPVVDRDGNVEAGNGRAIALQTAYANPDKHPRIEQYRQWIKEQGYPIPEGVKNPVLVRLRTDNLSQEELLEFTRATNDERTQALSATEQAFVDAERMPDGMVQEHTGGDLTIKRNIPFASRFFGAVVPKAARNKFIDSKGKLSKDGEKRMAAALLAKAYNNRRLVEEMAEATDEGRKTIKNVLIGIAPAWAKMQDRIKRGILHEDADITEALMDAANVFENFDTFRKNSKYDDWSAAGLMDLVLSPDLPGVERPYMVPDTHRNKMARAMIDMFYHEPRKTRKGVLRKYSKLRSKDKIIADLEAYLDKVNKFNPNQGGMFGDQIASAPDPIDILKEVKSVEPTKLDDIEVIEEKIDDEPAAGEPAALREPDPQQLIMPSDLNADDVGIEVQGKLEAAAEAAGLKHQTWENDDGRIWRFRVWRYPEGLGNNLHVEVVEDQEQDNFAIRSFHYDWMKNNSEGSVYVSKKHFENRDQKFWEQFLKNKYDEFLDIAKAEKEIDETYRDNLKRDRALKDVMRLGEITAHGLEYEIYKPDLFSGQIPHFVTIDEKGNEITFKSDDLLTNIGDDVGRFEVSRVEGHGRYKATAYIRENELLKLHRNMDDIRDPANREEAMQWWEKQIDNAWSKLQPHLQEQARQAAEMEQVREELSETLKKLAPNLKLGLEVRKSLGRAAGLYWGKGTKPAERSEPIGVDEDEINGLIQIAMETYHYSQEHILHHEAIHALRRNGLFTDAEWKTLRRTAVENKWLDKYETEKYYSHLFKDGTPTDEAFEEAIAQAFSYWATRPQDRAKLTGLEKVESIFERIREFFRKLVAILRKYEVPINPYNLFEDIEAGIVGSRDWQNMKAVQQASAESTELRGPDPFYSQMMNVVRDAKVSEKGMKLQGWKELLTRQKSGIRKAELDDIAFGSLTRLLEGETRILSDLSLISISMNLGRIADANSRIKKEVMQEYLRRYQPKIEVVKYGGVDEGNVHSLARETGGIGWTGKDGKKISKDLIKAVFRTGAMFENNSVKNFFKENDNEISRTLEPPGKELLEKYDLPVDEDLPSIKQVLKVDVSRSYSGIFSIETYNVESEEYDHYESKFLHDVFHALNVSVGRTYFKKYQENSLFERGAKWEGWVHKGGYSDYQEIMIRSPEGFRYGEDKSYGHWDKNDVVAHFRASTRTINGKKTLFLEEVQSDIHQGTQKETRGLKKRIAEVREELETHERGTEEAYKYYKDAGKNVPEGLIKMREAARKQLEEGIKEYERMLAESGQPGPFAKTEEWVRLALKQAMEIAAKEGHEAIAWATGVSESLMQKRYEFHGIEADEVKKGFVDDDVKFSEEQLEESTEYNLNQDRQYIRGLEKFYGQTIPSVLKKYFRQQGWQWAEKGGKDIAVVDFGPELYAEYIGISDTKYISQNDFEYLKNTEFEKKLNEIEGIFFKFRSRREIVDAYKNKHPKTVHMTKEDFETSRYGDASERDRIYEKYRPQMEKIAQEYIDNWVDVNFTKVGPSKAFWVPVGKEVSASITEKGQPRYLAQSTDMPPILQDLEAEKRLKKAEEGIQPDTLTARIGEALTVMGRKFTRRYEHIDKTPENAEVIQRILGLESEKHTAQDRVANILKRVSHGLNEGEQKTLTRYFVFQDLLWTAEQGMELPFGLPDLDSVALELRKLQSRIDSRPELKKRADIRQEELTKLKNQMVRHGVLRPEQARNPHYFRHQVLAYAKIRKMAGSGKKVSSTYWHTRRGSEKDINANYIQAEAEWMFKAYNDIATMKFINWIKQSKYDNKPNYVRMAKKQNTDNLNKWMDTDYLEKWVNPDKIEEFYNTDPAEQFEQIDELRQWLEDQGLEDWINFDLVEESAQNFDEWVGERDIRSWLDVDNLEKLLDKRKKEVAPYKELNKKIAMSMSGLAKALKQMPQSEWERIPEELRPHVQALMNRKRTMEQDHPIFGAIAWLAGQSHDPDVQMSALGFLGAVNRRKKFIKDVALKDSYIEPQSTKELIKHFGKEGEVAWQPDSYDGKTKAIHIFTGKSVPDHVADRMIDTLTESWEKLLEGNTDIDIPVEDFATFVQSIRDARMLGGPKLELIINDSLAETLNEFNDNEIANGFDWLARTITSRWRQWILFNPRRVSKYLLNNRTGDLDALLGNPSATGAVKYIPTAVKEMQRFYKDEKPSKLLIEAMDKGVVQTGLTMQEIQSAGELGTTPGGDMTINPFSKSVTPVRWARKYFEKVRNFTRVLENGVRYAAYLHYRDQLVTQGKSLEDIGFGASPQWVLKGLNDPIDVAAVMARDALGDYGNLSVAGEWARKRLMAFPSWLETNTVRYVHLFKNAYLYGKHVSGKDGLRMGTITAASMFARIGLFYGLVQAWNNIFFGDEEEEMSPEERIRLHLHVGKWDDEIWTIRFQGALSDFLGWFGMEDAGAMLTEVQHGRASMGDVIKAVAKAPPNRIIQGVNPVYKVPVELGLGRQLYPDTFNPRSIRDPWQHFFRTFSMEHEYAAVSKALGRNVPSRGYGRSMLNALLYSRDPGEMAYDNFRNKAYEWLSNKKDRDVPARIDPRSTALYLYRKAVRYGDKRAIDIAKRGLREHNLLGKNILASKRRAHPLGMLSRRERREFFKTLSAKDRDQLTRATKWYRETYWGAKATK